MKTRKVTKVHLLSILVPCLFLIVILGSPLLGDQIFYRVGFMDPQWFHWCYSHNGNGARPICYNNWCNNTPNPNFINAAMYYSLLQEAGFKQTSSMVINGDTSYLHRDSSFYHGIQVFNSNTGNNADKYVRSQCFAGGVGPGERDYFRYPHSAQFEAIPDPEPPYPGVFFCDRSTDSVDTLICQTLFKTMDSRLGKRRYFVDLVLRVDDIQDSTYVLKMKFGPGAQGCEYNPNQENETDFQNYPWSSEGNSENEQTDFGQWDTLDVHDLHDGYNRVTFVYPDSFQMEYPHNMYLLIYWLDHMDLYLDSIYVYDKEYKDFVMTDSAQLNYLIKADARSNFDTVIINSFYLSLRTK